MADRPIECSQCKKAVQYLYKEIIEDTTTCQEMCADCPILERKLHGTQEESSPLSPQGNETGLCCMQCRTTLESIKMGSSLGCSECYAVFDDVLVHELIAEGKIPAHLQKELLAKKMQTIHVGQTPTQCVTITPSSRLIALNEALNEALKKENYEQAAWLRDQIKALNEKSANGKDSPA